ncbi:MAG TPA: helix-turn-helix transcriptional regulator [Actinokineospora sp.]|jgi:transcriptional regulator with XRE-family HTH domain|nr:helix-turn-helix transcriptional regulator [Actinokineospora sp.]
MSERHSARLRALATELTTARNRAGLKLREVEAKLDVSIASLSRMENAQRTPTARLVAAMLAIYGVVGDERKRLMKMVDEVSEATWLEVRPDFGEVLKALIGFESKARSILHFSSMTIPGLLQTSGYARSIITRAGHTEPVAEALIAARLERQQVLNRLVSPRYVAFLDEAALRRAYGGNEVMAEQMRWLIDCAKRPHISVHVIPFRHGGYDVSGFFALLEFPEVPPIAYVEQVGLSGFVDRIEGIHRFRQAAATLERVALGSADSVNFLARMAADYERG